MSPARDVLGTRAQELRQVFDLGFAAPLPPPPPPLVALLLVRAGDERLAVRQSALTGLTRAVNFAAAPGRAREFLGFAGHSGELLPVWSLAALLGGVAMPLRSDGWLLLAATAEATGCAFACERFEEMIFLPESVFAPAPARPFVPAVVSWGGHAASVVDVPAILTALTERT